MKFKSLLGIAAAVLVTVLVSVGVVVFRTGGDDSAGDASVSSKVTKSARTYTDSAEIAKVLTARGATGCAGEAERIECRFQNRYVAATVLPADSSLTMDTALQSWKSGLGQSMLGDQSSFGVLYGPNWLVTGPQKLTVALRPALGGKLIRCDRPFGGCR